MKDSGTSTAPVGQRAQPLLPLEIISAKEAKNRRDCRGNPLGCLFIKKTEGLQCGLSGNPVSRIAGGV